MYLRSLTLENFRACKALTVDSLAPPPGRGWARTTTSMFKTAGKQVAVGVALARGAANPHGLAVNTVHGVKGEGADAVLFVLSADVEVATKLLAAWRDRITDDEAKRVAYVGVTRAKRLLGLAVPAALSTELVARASSSCSKRASEKL